MLNVVLVEPEIPANTGNIGRTCVLTGSRLHLVGPLGFDLSQKAVQRAGLGYWQSLDLTTYRSWDDFVKRALKGMGSHVHLLTKRAERTYVQSTYHQNDWLIFGQESGGLPKKLLDAHPDLCERIPMYGDDVLSNASTWHQTHENLHPELQRDICGNFVDERVGQISSLNLSNAVAIVVYEALRQPGFPNMNA